MSHGRLNNLQFSVPSSPAFEPTQSSVQWVAGSNYHGVKRLGRVADHSPPTNVEVNKMWIYTHFRVSLHDVAPNLISRGTTLLFIFFIVPFIYFTSNSFLRTVTARQ
jgi:hypothetical protein